MADTLDIGGKHVKKSTAIGVAVAAAVVIAVAVYRSKHDASAAAPAASAGQDTGAGTAAGGTDPYPPDGTTGDPGDPNSTDPATGQTYGDEDTATAQDSLGGGGYIAYPVGSVASGQAFTSNGAWAQYVEQYMTGTLGADPAAIAAAIGPYIDGKPVDEDQERLIEQAIAFAGQPPVAGPGGMPPSINLAAAKPRPKPKPKEVKVPDVVGVSYAEAVTVLSAAGLKATRAGPGKVVQQRPAAGTEVTRGSTVTLFGANK
jgi:hypothetical protein